MVLRIELNRMIIEDVPENMFVGLDPLVPEKGDIPLDQLKRRADYLCQRMEIETKLQDYLLYGNYSSLGLLLSQMGIQVETNSVRGDKSQTDTLRENAAMWGNTTFGKVSYALHVAGIPNELKPEDLAEPDLPAYLMEMYRFKMLNDTSILAAEKRGPLVPMPREYDITTSFLGVEHMIMNQERTVISHLWQRYKQNAKNIPESLLQQRDHYELWLQRSADFYKLPNAPSNVTPLAGEIRSKPISIMPVVFRNEDHEPIAIYFANANHVINDAILSRFLSLANFGTITDLMSEGLSTPFNPEALRATINHIKDIYVNSLRARDFDQFDTIINDQAQMIMDLEEIFDIGRRDVTGETRFFNDAECALLKVSIYYLFALNASIKSVINKVTSQDIYPNPTKERDLTKNIIELFTRTLEFSAEEMIKKF